MKDNLEVKEDQRDASESSEEPIIVELNRLVRFHQFDWIKVAQDMNDFFKQSSAATVVDPKWCRELFAQCNEVRIPIKTESTTLNKAPSTGSGISTSNSSQEKIDNFSSYTLEELMEHVEKTEIELMKKKEEVFQRVLDSLGGSGENRIYGQSQMINDPATSAYFEARRAKEELKHKQELKKLENEEKAKLDHEREVLRRRFDEDSEDADGDYPNLISEKKGNVDDENLITMNDQIAVTGGDISLESALGGEAFDILLSELEKELDSQAMDKSEGSYRSQLSLYFSEITII